ncbi:adenylate kinase [Candidatus Uhrbacteria bacterium CG_4_10_14_0_2_um_filter_41_7]|uniref:Adenylate kinase n=1 Tax=Candidatus Uhrbacteria bacterium CG_4_9_14_3_um_filter_41_35 TaxID=1975034 RepID=A0A2M7XG22_9BACT|nr:MAG: adenylate kinase [Candidatus Uhrbacteria bacterium CG11_big_fil_rev_8_21_14_0_20_41_9]PIZ55477.1 MAG: adenylate kinase [Candidatus Uhrbacteria bacterium CG_4_10_14_0_2_um_filter_41_7]PJA46823.1 MAG: adenylate kinase [Candidatus Uhrbacteria bacterium CG_4_9_14_3_um_filter_41_35]
MQKILIAGPQGSGKGTQATRLSQKLGIPALSMGQLLRDQITEGGELGKEISKVIYEDGELVSDELALRILKKRLEQADAQDGYILDGYPRNVEQYNAFKAFDMPTAVILINVPLDESMRRLARRADIEKRADDEPEQIKRRLEIYEEETKPVLELFKSQGVLKVIDGMGTMEEVEERIEEALVI